MSRLGTFILPNHGPGRARQSTQDKRGPVTQAHEYLRGGSSSLIESVPDIRTKVNMSEIQQFFALATYGVVTRGGRENACEQFAINIGQSSLSQSQKLNP